MMTSVPLASRESISTVSPSVCPIFTDSRVTPVAVYIRISPSHSAMIEIAPSGSVRRAGQSVSSFGENDMRALSPIYGCPSGSEIRTVERRLALATVERAVMTPVRVRSATSTQTLCPTVRDATRLGSISMIICGWLLVNSAIGVPILTDCPIFAITLLIIPLIGATTRSLLASRSA